MLSLARLVMRFTVADVTSMHQHVAVTSGASRDWERIWTLIRRLWRTPFSSDFRVAIGQMHLIADPMQAMFGRIPGLGIIR